MAVVGHGEGEDQTDERNPDAVGWVAIACASDAQWAALTLAMGDPAWAGESAFATEAGRRAIGA